MYAAEQARELNLRGHRLRVLATARAVFNADAGLDVKRILVAVPESVRHPLLRKALFIAQILLNQIILTHAILTFRPRIILFDAYSEMLSPVWALPHLIFSRLFGVKYAVTVHDPERVKRFGPDWWHRFSVRCAYAPFSVALVHELDNAQQARIPSHVKLAEVPHGAFTLPSATSADGLAIRRRIGIPEVAPLALSFGYVADRKNIDIAIASLPQSPTLHLLVAGSRASSADRPISFYVDLARELGVDDRTHFLDEYISDKDVSALFEAATLVLITYRRDFVSQSGVLHIACNWDKPVVASSGDGPLTHTVNEYRLGLCVEPDSSAALGDGLQTVLAGNHESLGWEEFRRHASWATNVDRLLHATGDRADNQGAKSRIR